MYCSHVFSVYPASVTETQRLHDKSTDSVAAPTIGMFARCRVYNFPVVKNVPIDVSAHAQ